MDESDKKAFDFAAELTKQLITLATGMIALTITFSKDFLQRSAPAARPWALWAWGMLLASVVFGIWTMMALTGSLGRGSSGVPSVYGANVKLPSALQIVTFLIGLLLTVVFAGKSI
jgi:hypothetical protein